MAEVTELTVDDGYKNIRIRIDGNIVATQEIIESVTITVGCTDGSAPAFGASFSPHCDVTINSNEIIGDSALDAIVMGAIFIVECELTTGVYEAMGRFEIGQPVQYTDDYMISFSGEGMLGSVLGRKKMNWDLMRGLGDNAKKGILTLNQAIGLVHSQFPNVTIELPDSQFMPPDYEHMKIVVPLSLNKWKKNVAFKKRFVKLTVRDFVAGIAVMLVGNVVEYGDSIRIVSIREAWNNESIVDDKFFTADSYMADYTAERIPYAPKSLRLKTYVTLPVTTSKKGSSSKTTHGYCYEDDCECGSVYGYSESTSGINLYDAYVDCQWIGRSFEAFFFNGGVVSTVNSGEYDDDYETLHSNFKYTPLTVEFSGWNDIFEPAHFIKIRTVKKNTATQQETTVDALAYIADMTFTWNGTISVQISSSYNGEAGEVTVTIGNNQASSAWNNGTNIPEVADIIINPPVANNWVFLDTIANDRYGSYSGMLYENDKLHSFSRRNSGNTHEYTHYIYENNVWREYGSFTSNPYNYHSMVIYNNKIYGITYIQTSQSTYKTILRNVYDANDYYDFPNSHPQTQVYATMTVANGELHIIFNNVNNLGQKHYKLSNNEIVLVTNTLPVELSGYDLSSTSLDDSVFVCDGGRTNAVLEYNGTDWQVVSSLPTDVQNVNTEYMGIVGYNGYLHLIGTKSSGTHSFYHYYWDNEWVQLEETPSYYGSVQYSAFDYNSGFGQYNDKIVMCGVIYNYQPNSIMIQS